MVSASLGSLDGYEAVENTYTFTGKPKTVKHVHTSNESKANKNTIEEMNTSFKEYVKSKKPLT